MLCVFRISIIRHVRHFANSMCVIPTSTNIMKLGNNKWLNAYVQARIRPPPIPLIKETNIKTEGKNIIKIKMRQDPVSATSETYELKV